MFAHNFIRATSNIAAKRVVTRQSHVARPVTANQWGKRWSSSNTRAEGNATRAEPLQSSATLWTAAALVVGAGGFYAFSGSKDNNEQPEGARTVATPAGPQLQLPPKSNPAPLDYNDVYKEVADMLESEPGYDDGSFGPILVRLAWHCSGTYDKAAGNGGSNKATMRYKSESEHGGNAGLNHARDLMEKIHQRHPQISYGDLWTLAGVCAIQQMGGPVIPWRPGRTDGAEHEATPDGRLPDATKGVPHIRDIFYRMGFNDKDIVVLSGAHAIGRCHTTRSGFDGPWTPSPTMITNDYYKQLLEKTWVVRNWKGPKQYQDKETKELMMLPTDMALLEEPSMRKWVEIYAKNEELWRKDFAEAITKLFELGVPFKKDTKVFRFKTIE